MLLDGIAVALHEVIEQIDMRVHVALEIHRHKARKLHEAWVDWPHESGVRKRHGTNHGTLEPFQTARFSELIDACWVAPGIYRTAHQRHGCGLAGIVDARHMRGGRQNRYCWLAHANHMRIGTNQPDEVDNVIDKVVEVEAAHGKRNVTRIGPVGDVGLVVGQHCLDSAAQKRRVMARKGRDDQHLRVGARTGGGFLALEVQQLAKWCSCDNVLADRHVDVSNARRL